jgi:signal transduction histidine kinase
LTTIYRPTPVGRQRDATGADNAHGRRESSREYWFDAASSVARQLEAETTRNPLRVVAEALLFAADADCVVILAPTTGDGRLQIALSVGPSSDDIAARLLTDAPSLASYVARTREPLHVRDNHGRLSSTLRESDSVLLLPLPESEGAQRVVAAVRLAGRQDFTPRVFDLAAAFTHHAGALAQLSAARATRQRRQSSEERERMAAALHGAISRQLFSVGLTLQGVASGLAAGPMSDRLTAATVDLDNLIRQVRASVVELTKRPLES